MALAGSAWTAEDDVIHGVRLLLLLTFLGCIGSTPKDSPSPAKGATILVWGDAGDIVLVDPRGRVSRENELDTDVEIPDFDRWNGGTKTTLDDSTGPAPASNVKVQFELSRPLVGRYKMFVEAKGAGNFGAEVTPNRYGGTAARYNAVKCDVQRGSGRYVWNIDFLGDSSSTACFVRGSNAIRAPKEKGSRP